MQLDGWPTGRLRFQGRAAELLRQGAVASATRELGENYAAYHAYLAEEFAKWGGPPDPGPYGDDFTRYMEDCTLVADLIRSEALLRRTRHYRLSGRALDQLAPLDDPPLVLDGALVSVESGA